MKCPECTSNNITNTSIEKYCNYCGLVIDSSPIEESEVDSNLLFFKFDEFKSPIRSKYQNTALFYSYKEKAILSARKTIEQIVNRLHLSIVVLREADIFFQKLFNKGYLVGRSIRLVIIACIYWSAKSHNITLCIKVISDKLGESVRAINSNIRKVGLELGFKFTRDGLDLEIERYFNTFKFNKEEREYAFKLLKETKFKFQSRKKNSIFGFILYSTIQKFNLSLTLKSVCYELNIYPNTVRNLITSL